MMNWSKKTNCVITTDNNIRFRIKKIKTTNYKAKKPER